MSDGSGPILPLYGVKENYTISERIALLTAYRALVEKMASTNGGRMSVQEISEIFDDAFNEFSHWTTVREPLFKTAYKKRLDPTTLRNLLRCEPVRPAVRKVHVRSLRIIHAFLQIIRHDPPRWFSKAYPAEVLIEIFQDDFPESGA